VTEVMAIHEGGHLAGVSLGELEVLLHRPLPPGRVPTAPTATATSSTPLAIAPRLIRTSRPRCRAAAQSPTGVAGSDPGRLGRSGSRAGGGLWICRRFQQVMPGPMTFGEIERNHGPTLRTRMRAHPDFNEAITSITIRVVEPEAVQDAHEGNTNQVAGADPHCSTVPATGTNRPLAIPAFRWFLAGRLIVAARQRDRAHGLGAGRPPADRGAVGTEVMSSMTGSHAAYAVAGRDKGGACPGERTPMAGMAQTGDPAVDHPHLVRR